MAPHRIFLLAVAATLLASQASAQDAQVMHWWTSGGESRAVAVFAKEYEKRGGKWIDSASVGPQAEHAAVLNAIAGGNPPSSISVEYRSCRPPARRARAADEPRRSGQSRRLEPTPAAAAGQEHHCGRPCDCRPGQSTRRQLDVLQHEGLQ